MCSPHLLVDIPHLPGKPLITIATESVDENHQTAEPNELLSLSGLIGLANPGLKEVERVAQVQHEFFYQVRVLGDWHCFIVIKDLFDASLRREEDQLVRWEEGWWRKGKGRGGVEEGEEEGGGQGRGGVEEEGAGDGKMIKEVRRRLIIITAVIITLNMCPSMSFPSML